MAAKLAGIHLVEKIDVGQLEEESSQPSYSRVELTRVSSGGCGGVACEDIR